MNLDGEEAHFYIFSYNFLRDGKFEKKIKLDFELFTF
jgi:hypothetical protein